MIDMINICLKKNKNKIWKNEYFLSSLITRPFPNLIDYYSTYIPEIYTNETRNEFQNNFTS